MGGRGNDAAELNHLRALAHPLRMRLLSLATGQPVSAAEAARELGCTQANASYHLRRLHAAGWVRVVERTSVRGGQSVRYRYTDPDTTSAGTALRRPSTVDDQLMLAEVLGHELRRRTAQRDTSVPGHLTDAELWVTPADWQACLEQVTAASTALHHRARPARTPGTIPTSTTLSLFQLRPPGSNRAPRNEW